MTASRKRRRNQRRTARALVPAGLTLGLAVAIAAIAGCGANGNSTGRPVGVRIDASRTVASKAQPPSSITISSIPASATTRPTLPPSTTPSAAPADHDGSAPATTLPPTTAAPNPTPRHITVPATSTTTPAASTTPGKPTTTTKPGASTTSTTSTTTPAPTTTTSLPSGPPPVCRPTQLSADQVQLAAGTGHYFLAWSLTDTTGTACRVPGGRPTLELDNAAGQAVVQYKTAPLPGGSTATVTVARHHPGWFLTEEDSTTCEASTGVTGGPFAYKITLPGGAGTVSWRPSYLNAGAISDLCTRVGLEVGPIEAAQPRA